MGETGGSQDAPGNQIISYISIRHCHRRKKRKEKEQVTVLCSPPAFTLTCTSLYIQHAHTIKMNNRHAWVICIFIFILSMTHKDFDHWATGANRPDIS